MKIERMYFQHYRVPKSKTHAAILDFVSAVSGHGYNKKYYRYSRRKTEWQPAVNGGKTECHLVLDNGVEIVGVAECSMQDNFCYATGREISKGRALKKFAYYQKQREDFVYHAAKIPEARFRSFVWSHPINNNYPVNKMENTKNE